jgi:hypothetical protein
MGSNQTKRRWGDWSGVLMSPRPIKTLVLGVSWSSSRGHSFSLELSATLFQAAIYNIKVCIMENIEKVYTQTYVVFLIVRQLSKPLTLSCKL